MFKRFFMMEFRKTIFRWQAVAGLVVFMGAFMQIATAQKMGFSTLLIFPPESVLELSNPFMSFISVLAWPIDTYMVFVIPLVGLLIFGDSLLIDYKSGFYQFSLTRISYKSYIKNKIFAVLSLAFLIMLMFQMIAFVFLLFTSPFHFPSGEIGGRIVLNSILFVSNPFVYIFITMVIIGLVSMAFASLGLVCSSMFRSSPSVVGAGWLLYLFSHVLASFFESDIYRVISPLIMSGPILFDFPDYVGFSQIIVYWLVLITILTYTAYVAFERKTGFRKV